jgi:type II secretory pathway component PulC
MSAATQGTRIVRPACAVALLCAAVLAAAFGPAAAQAPQPPGIVVTGVIRGKVPLAIFRVDGYTYVAGVGELAADYRVAAILPDRVVLKRAGLTYALPTPKVPLGPPQAGIPPMPAAAMSVTGIIRGRTRLAIIRAGGQTFVAAEGEFVGSARVASIQPTKVILRQNGVVFELPAPGAFPPGAAPLAVPPGATLTLAGIVAGRVPLAILRAAGFCDRICDAVVEAIGSDTVRLRRGGAVIELPVAGLAVP